MLLLGAVLLQISSVPAGCNITYIIPTVATVSLTFYLLHVMTDRFCSIVSATDCGVNANRVMIYHQVQVLYDSQQSISYKAWYSITVICQQDQLHCYSCSVTRNIVIKWLQNSGCNTVATAEWV